MGNLQSHSLIIFLVMELDTAMLLAGGMILHSVHIIGQPHAQTDLQSVTGTTIRVQTQTLKVLMELWLVVQTEMIFGGMTEQTFRQMRSRTTTMLAARLLLQP